MLEAFFVILCALLGLVIFLYASSFYDDTDPLSPLKDSTKQRKPKSAENEKKLYYINDDSKIYTKGSGKTIPSLGMEADCFRLKTIDNVKNNCAPNQPIQPSSSNKVKSKSAKLKEVDDSPIDPADFAKEMQRRAREMNEYQAIKPNFQKKAKSSIGQVSGAAIKVNKDLIAKSHSWTT